jgi:putative ABC transport system substrate-binding protein
MEEMDRSLALAGIVLLLATTAAGQTGPPKKARVGFVGHHSPGLEWGILVPYQARMRELGWIEDETLTTIYRWAEGELSNYPRIVREVVEAGVDVVVLPCGPPLRALRELDRAVPAVTRCLDHADLAGEITAPGQPGGNTTGFTYFSPAATTRRLELLRAIVPGLRDVGVLVRWKSDWIPHLPDVEAAAGRLGLGIHRANWGWAHELPRVLDRVVEEGVGALLTLGDGPTHHHRHTLFTLAAERRLPVLYDFPMPPSADDVGLMSYYADLVTGFRTVAEQVDQILRGRPAGDIPFVEPSRFRFVLNERAARGLGLAVPESLRQQAGKVFE